MAPIHFPLTLILREKTVEIKSFFKSFINKSHPELNVQMKHRQLKGRLPPLWIYDVENQLPPTLKDLNKPILSNLSVIKYNFFNSVQKLRAGQ